MAKRKQKKNLKPVLAVVGAMFTFLILALPVTMKAMQTSLFESFGVVQLFSTEAPQEFNKYEELKFEYEMAMNHMQGIEMEIQQLEEKKKHLFEEMQSTKDEQHLKQFEMEVQDLENVSGQLHSELQRAQEKLQSLEGEMKQAKEAMEREEKEKHDKFEKEKEHDFDDKDLKDKQLLKEERERQKKLEEEKKHLHEKQLREEKLLHDKELKEKREREHQEKIEERKRAGEKFKEEHRIEERLQNSHSCKEQVLRKLANEGLTRKEINVAIERECTGDAERRVVDHRVRTERFDDARPDFPCEEEIMQKYKGRNIADEQLKAMINDICGVQVDEERHRVDLRMEDDRFKDRFEDKFDEKEMHMKDGLTDKEKEFFEYRFEDGFDGPFDEKFEEGKFRFEDEFEGAHDRRFEEGRHDIRPKEDLEMMRKHMEERLRMKKRDRELLRKEMERHGDHGGDHFGEQVEAEIEDSVEETEEALKAFENKLNRCEQYYNNDEKEKYMTCSRELDIMNFEQGSRDMDHHSRMMNQNAERFRKMVEEYKIEAQRQGAVGASEELEARVEKLKSVAANVASAKAEVDAIVEKMKANADSEDLHELMEEHEKARMKFEKEMEKMGEQDFHIPDEKFHEIDHQRIENFTGSSVDSYRGKLARAERIAEKFAQVGADISGLKDILGKGYVKINDAESRLQKGEDPETVLSDLEQQMDKTKRKYDRETARLRKELRQERIEQHLTQEEQKFIEEDDFMTEEDLKEQFEKHHSAAGYVDDMLDNMSEKEMRKMMKQFLRTNPEALKKFGELQEFGVAEEDLQRIAKNIDIDTFVERKEKVRDEMGLLKERLAKKHRAVRAELEEINKFVLKHPLSENQTELVQLKINEFIETDQRGELTEERIRNMKRWLHEDVKPQSVKELYLAGETVCIDRAPDEWDYEAMKFAAEHGVMEGRPGGVCDLAAKINVAEAAKAVVNSSPLEANDGVISGEWYAKYTSARGLDLPSDPAKLASRAEVVRALVKAFDPNMNDVPSEPYFKDIDQNHPSFKYIQWAAQNGIVKSGAEYPFFYDDATNRGQVATMIQRIMTWEAENASVDGHEFEEEFEEEDDENDPFAPQPEQDHSEGEVDTHIGGLQDSDPVAERRYDCIDPDFEGSDLFSQIETQANPYEGAATIGQKGGDPSAKPWDDRCAGATLREYYCVYGEGYLGDVGLHVERDDIRCEDLTGADGQPLSCLTDAQGFGYCG